MWEERVSQQAAFSCGCATANQLLHFKEVGQSWGWVHFPALNMSLPGETLPGKMQFPFFGSLAVVMPKRNTDESVALCLQLKDSRTQTTNFQREISDRFPCTVNLQLGYTILK